MENNIREQLFELAEKDYKKFTSGLLPNNDNILGVRLPALRKMAKRIVKGDWHSYLESADMEYFEEIMLSGMIIGYAKADIEEILSYVLEFVPKIDNWSVCDSFCIGLKIVNDNKERVWNFLKPYFTSDEEFEIRFGVVMLLDFYIDEEYIEQVLTTLDHIKHAGYYVKMAVAWAVSICYIKQPDTTLAYLENNALDDFTYNKALQKITESLRIDQETKKLIQSRKRR
jgi:3-methyladenine DNA glycosylase AlkD